MSAPLPLPPCPIRGREPFALWSHTIGSPQRFRISCEMDSGHWLRVTKRTRAEAVREWRRIAGGGRNG